MSELKKFTNTVDEKLAANDSSSSRKSNATSLKMLLAKEMAKEVELKRRPPSVIARLMGLEEDLSTEEPIVHHAKCDDLNRDLKETNKALHGKEHNQSISLMRQDHQLRDETVESNDVYEVCEEQSGTSDFQDRTSKKGWSSENKSKELYIVQAKFMEPKRFAMGEKLLHTKELQEDVEVPSSTKDIFLELPEEPNSAFSRQLSGLHTNRSPPQTKRITVLKPIRSVEITGVRQSGTERVNKQNGLKMRKFHQNPSSKEEISSQPSRIVLLRPTPGKPGISKAKLTPRATSIQLINRNILNGSLDDNRTTIGSAGLVHGDMQHWQHGRPQRADSLLSSAYSNGYVGDESSFSDSEVDHSSGSDIEEDGGTLSDSEGGSPLSKHSWNYIRRYEGPCSGSSLSKISHFPESSVIREGKKQLSERWAMVTCDETTQEQVQSSRRTCTLAEILSIKATKKDDVTTGILSVSSNRSCGMENEPNIRSTYVTTSRKNGENGERSPRKLPRSNSVPVISSTLDNMVANVQASNPESRKLKVVVVSNKSKSFFKARVSDFFLPRSKRPRRQKSTYHPSDCFAERIEACAVRSRPDYNHNLDANEKEVHCQDKTDSFATQISTSTIERTASIGVTMDCPSGNLDKLGVNKGLNRDQPSPTSVLDAPSEDSSCNEPETYGRTFKNAISRSSAIEAVACSLSWDDSTSESQLLCTPRLPSLFSDVDDDESECHVLVQNIMSSAGLGSARSSMAFTGWHLPDYPLDPVLRNKVLELREQSSYRRLLFDSVNVALLEIGENALLSAFPWSKKQFRTWRGTSSPDLGVEIWSILKDWIYGARMFVVSKRDSSGVILDRIVKQAVEGRGWVKLMMSQAVDITEQLEGGVMEELVEETVLDFATCFRQ
ncbi:uncharacterized protein LOC133919323 isoform X2 [Phragmites australis]|uniref:uncharacterized protein LOC133919323 isoform X2 n=1 Tax=Phragmites australis TaxID=29695 RepID=UPI002D779140|nr:uncharacterized protein LOC133919323 isoform X2 [Phragmites australis]